MTIQGADRGGLFIRVIPPEISGGFRFDVLPRDLSHLQLLEGVSECEALSRLRRLFSLCGIAQERIAIKALEAAHGKGENNGCFDEEVFRESLVESLRSLLLPLAGDPLLPMSSTASWQRLGLLGKKQNSNFLSDFRFFLEEDLLGEDPAIFLKRQTVQEWRNWLRNNKEKSPVAHRAESFDSEGDIFLPRMSGLTLSDRRCADFVARALDDRTFLSAPHMNGDARETGSLSRIGDHSLVNDLWSAGFSRHARLAARLLELASFSVQGNGRPFAEDDLGVLHSCRLGVGVGMAWGQTSRGLLVHRWDVQQGEVQDVRILAPTEWIFSPKGGPFSLWLAALGQRKKDLGSLRRLVVETLWLFDPCAPVGIVEAPSSAG